MRKDIQIKIRTGDIQTKSSISPVIRKFRWVENKLGVSRYIYGEIDVPDTVTEQSIRENGVFFNIPYTPKYQEFMVRIRRISESGPFFYVANRDSGGEWFIVKSGLYGTDLKKNVFASKLVEIADGEFYGRIGNNCLELYSSFNTDFHISSADRQNANCLLACNPSNNYRYPLTGVGLVRWINSGRINSGELADVLQKEFAEDGVIVKNAQYDYETKSMTQLDLDTSNAK